MKFRGYVFEWPRVTQATPQSGWKKSNIPRRKYTSNEANKHKTIIQDVSLTSYLVSDVGSKAIHLKIKEIVADY